MTTEKRNEQELSHECKFYFEMEDMSNHPRLAFVERMNPDEIEEYRNGIEEVIFMNATLTRIDELIGSKYLSDREKAMLANRASKLSKLSFETCYKLGMV
jgi:hypothetical protein